MNKKYGSILIGFLIVVGGALSFYQFATPSQYEPRTTLTQDARGAAEFIAGMRQNQITGKVAIEDVNAAKMQIMAERQKATKVDWPLNWSFSGPDDVAGRSRCIVIDKDNPNILYTGGVTGSVFKSINQGGSWTPLTIGDDNFGISSMAQTDDGNIYYGTGEGGYVGVNGNESGGFNGFGIFKSTDGETFSLLTNTTSFGSINVITAHGSDLYVGSQSGLRHSNDGGNTWTLVRPGQCKEVKISNNNVALAFVGNIMYRSTTPTVNGSYSTISATNIISSSGNGRGVAAWSDSDPNYGYVVTTGAVSLDGTPYSSALNGIYRTTDGGDTWVEEVDQASVFFAPFTNVGLGAQGWYDMAAAVHPKNKDRLFIGGVGFAEWSPNEGPKIVGNTFDVPTNPFGIHADKHFITFDNSGETPIMYICTDGGIARTTNASLTTYKTLDVGLSTTQFYGIAASREGKILGGTQDNGTMLISKESFPRKNSVEVRGGDGFQTEISEYDPNIMFGESYYGLLSRSTSGGGSMTTIWDNRIAGSQGTNFPSNIFHTAMHLWEDPVITDSVKTYGADPSLDSIMQSRLFTVMNNGIWMCNNALGEFYNPDAPSNDKIRWFRVSTLGNIHSFHSTRDGNSLFVGTNSGALYRIDGFNKANWDTTEISGYSDISDSLVQTNVSGNLAFGGRQITSIEVDPSNDNRVIVTAGNYGNSSYVKECTNALSASPTWANLQSNLPSFPVYHAIISRDDPNTIVLGTEFGIWATNNGGSGSPTWVESNAGVDASTPMPMVPVFELVEVEDKTWSGPIIYAGTYGMGIWETSSLTTSVKNIAKKSKEVLIIYPNPASSQITVETSIKGNYNLSVIDITGKEVLTQKGASSGTIKLNVHQLITGNYFVKVSGDGHSSVGKLLIQH